jgi:hypothetical protein
MLGWVRGRRRDAWLVLAAALIVRFGVVAWACTRFPAVEDGFYYDVLARRVASGLGYTWAWPDGAVTYAALYPVGYPALLALFYGVLGASAGVAMTVNAILGAIGACCAYRLVDGDGVARWRPVAAGLAVALHPALVPYTAAVMTEGVTASLLLGAAALADQARRTGRPPGWLVAVAVVMAFATLVRPQSILLAPVFGILAVSARAGWRQRVACAAVVAMVSATCVAPWTLRNCARMHRCALVSMNGGWNLLIGATTVTGAWQSVEPPAECATVWDEAAKDICFEKAARRSIVGAPTAWFARMPAKLASTFDYIGAAPWYLHASNSAAFDDEAKWKLGTAETVTCRLLLVGALVACGRMAGRRKTLRMAVAVCGAVAAVIAHGWIGYVALIVCVGLAGWPTIERAPLAVASTAAVVAATAVVHAAFFGAGRYGLAAVPFVAALAFVRFPSHRGFERT